MPSEKAARYLNYSESSVFAEVIDFHMCSRSDIFIPAFSNLFYTNVVGARIGLGKGDVLVPYQANSFKADDYISPYLTNRTHPAYSCFC